MLCSLVAFLLFAPKTISIVPKESVWVYGNASSPTDGTFLRAWGTGGKSCPEDGEDVGEFSYSYLKWDVSDVPADAKLVSAKLTLSNIPDPGFNLESSKKSPLEVRALNGVFDAKTWSFDMAAKLKPISTKTAVFGTGSAKEIKPGEPVEITIDLLLSESAFAKALQSAVASPNHEICLAITSALDPSVDGRSCVYKVYGQKESKENLRPRLTIVFE